MTYSNALGSAVHVSFGAVMETGNDCGLGWVHRVGGACRGDGAGDSAGCRLGRGEAQSGQADDDGCEMHVCVVVGIEVYK